MTTTRPTFVRDTVPGPAPVTVDALDVRFGTRTVLAGLDLGVGPGVRLGLVGENGSGKSTLLRALAGRLPARGEVSGRVRVPEDLRFLGQQVPYAESATLAEVRATWTAGAERVERRLEHLAAHIEEPGAADAYGTLMDLAVHRDVWGAAVRAQQAAARLGVDGLADDRTMAELSGGQRARLALVGLVAERPWCLLLDEPTNHLDGEALDLLTEFVAAHGGPVLLAPHDRVLLDDVATHLYDLDPTALGTDGRGGRLFGGTWSRYEAERAAARRRWEETWQAQQDEIARLREASRTGERDVAHARGPSDNDKFIHAFKGAGVQRAVSRRRRDAARRLDLAEREQVAKPRRPLRLAAELTSRPPGGRAIRVRDLRVPGRVALDRLDVTAGERLLVTGANGSGKSTLLGVLAGRVAHEGEVAVRGTLALLAQDEVLPDPAATPADLYAAAGCSGVALRELGLVHPRDERRPCGLLSVGQQRRVALAVAVAARPEVLLLDEPTNHLSLTLVGELEEALVGTPGTVVVASHDRWLRRRWDGPTLRLAAPGTTASAPPAG